RIWSCKTHLLSGSVSTTRIHSPKPRPTPTVLSSALLLSNYWPKKTIWKKSRNLSEVLNSLITFSKVQNFGKGQYLLPFIPLLSFTFPNVKPKSYYFFLNLRPLFSFRKRLNLSCIEQENNFIC